MEKPMTQSTLSQLRVWWFPLAVVTVIALGSLLVLIPQATQLLESRDSLKAEQKTLTQLQTKADQISQLDESYIEELASVVTLALPEHKPYYEMFAVLQQLAGQTGVYLGDFDLSPGSLATAAAKVKTSKDKGYVSLDTSVSIRGTTDQVVQFIDSLQSTLPLITVTSINISGDKNELDIRQAKLDMTVSYVSPETKNSTNVLKGTLMQLSDLDYQLFDTLLRYNAPMDQTASAAAFPDFNRQDVFSY